MVSSAKHNLRTFQGGPKEYDLLLSIIVLFQVSFIRQNFLRKLTCTKMPRGHVSVFQNTDGHYYITKMCCWLSFIYQDANKPVSVHSS